MKSLLLTTVLTLSLVGSLGTGSHFVLAATNPHDQLQLLAGDGGPQPVCAPGKNCNNDQFQLLAGDGGPQPVCAPGKNCNNDQLSPQTV